MAPVHNVNAYSVSASSSGFRSISHSSRESNDCWERCLPISSKGGFFQDSFFENTRARYEEKFRRILDDWEESETMFDERFNNASTLSQAKFYRNRRTQNKANQIVTVTSEDGGIKILLDVREFTAEEIRVRVVGEREVEVEGHRKQMENEASDIHQTPNKFRYLISLPEDAEMDTITSTMSSDGILSISVHKKETITKAIRQVPIETKEHNNASVSSLPNSSITSSGNSVNFSQSFNSLSSSNSSELFKMEKEVLENFGEMTEMEMNGYQSSPLLGETKKISSAVASDANMHSMDMKEDNRKEIQADCREFEHKYSLSEGNVRSTSRLEETSIRGINEDTLVTLEKEFEKHLTNGSSCSSAYCKYIPVIRRGCISKDAFFDNIKEVFCLTGNNDLVNWEEISTSDCETIKCCFYGDNIVKSAEDHSKYMYLVDVRDLQHREEINVKFFGEYELLIEIPEDRKSKVPSFQKRLVLTEDTQSDSVLSSLSSDGWLVITVQKKTPLNQPYECIVPVNLEETHLEVNNAQAAESGETMELMSEQTLTDDKNIAGDVGHSLQSSENVGNWIGTSQNLKSSKHRCDSLTRKLEENVILEDRGVLGKYSQTKSSNHDKDSLQLEAESHSGKNHVEHQAVSIQQKEENIEIDMTERNNIQLKTERNESELTDDCIMKEDTERNDSLTNGLNTQEAPVEEILSYRNDLSSAHDQMICEKYSSDVSKTLHIAQKGSFYSDSCFEGMQDYYLQAVRVILSKYGNQSSATDEVTSYRNLAKEDLGGNRVEVIFGIENYLLFILDVFDFQNEGEISLKIVNKDEIAIEAKSTATESNDVSTKFYSKCFKINEQVDLESAEATLSSEGLLVITLPKKIYEDSTSTTKETEEPLNSSAQIFNLSLNHKAVRLVGESSETVNSASENNLNSVPGNNTSFSYYPQNEYFAMPLDSQNREAFASSVINAAVKEEDGKDSVHLIDHETLNTNASTAQRYAVSESEATLDLQNTYQSTSVLGIDDIDGEMTESKNIAHLSVEKSSYPQVQDVQGIVQLSQNTTVYDKEEFIASEDLKSPKYSHASNQVSLEVEDKGSFYEDTFFEGMQNYLSFAVGNNLLNHCERETVEEDNMTLYRNGLKVDQRTVSVSFDDEYYHKVVVDARSLKNGTVTVKICDNKLLIEGFQGENEGDNFANHYSETFALSDDLDIKSAVAGISSNGILAIVIHKKNLLSDEKNKHNFSMNTTHQIDKNSSSDHQATFEVTNASSAQGNVSFLNSSSTLNSHVSSTAELVKYNAIQPRGDSDVLSETREDDGEAQIYISYQCRPDGDQELGNGPLPIVQFSRTNDEIEDTKDGNHNENEECKLEASRVAGTLGSLAVNDTMTDAELSSLSSNISYKGSLVEVHSRQSDTISTRLMAAGNDQKSDEEDFKENSANVFILRSNNDGLATNLSREDLLDAERNSHSEVSETCGFSRDTIQSLKSYTSTPMQNLHCSESRRLLSLTRKGTFFEDSYFNEVQESFLSAMREVLRKSNDDENCKHSSDIASYKCWRRHNHKIDKQAVYIHDDLSAYKVVLDVEGLSQNSLMVSVVDGKRLLIEGQAEILKNTSTESLLYSKSFLTPKEVDLDGVTATLSSDGILLIESPKK